MADCREYWTFRIHKRRWVFDWWKTLNYGGCLLVSVLVSQLAICQLASWLVIHSFIQCQITEQVSTAVMPWLAYVKCPILIPTSFLWFSSFNPVEFRDSTLKDVNIASCHILPDSQFISHLMQYTVSGMLLSTRAPCVPWTRHIVPTNYRWMCLKDGRNQLLHYVSIVALFTAAHFVVGTDSLKVHSSYQYYAGHLIHTIFWQLDLLPFSRDSLSLCWQIITLNFKISDARMIRKLACYRSFKIVLGSS